MQNFKTLLFTSAVGAVLLSACHGKQGNGEMKNDIIRANIDTTVNPCDDFFNYACGTWIKNNAIPASESAWGIGNLVQEEIRAKLRKTSENAAKANAAKGSSEQKIGDFYATAMDSVAIDRQGIAPLTEELKRIDEVADVPQFLAEIAHLHRIGFGGLVGIAVQQDSKKSDEMALYAWQGGLGLPNRDYYFNTDARTANIRKEYVQHIANMLRLQAVDETAAKVSAEKIIILETAIAKASRKLEALRDPYANYNKMAVVDLKKKLTPEIDWKSWLATMNIENVDSIIVGQPEFLSNIDQLLKNTPIATWKSYMKFHLLSAYASDLSSAVDKEDFHFYGTILQGKTEQRPRWKRVLDEEEGVLGELLGQLFVKDYYSPKAKARYTNMVDEVIMAFEDHIKALDWMSDSTKQKALVKLHKINKKVGYPDKWKDLSKLEIVRGSHLKNIMNAQKFWYDYSINKLGKPVDRTEWDMTPQTYNAYYNPSNNEIVLPAAIFAIPGVKDEDADDAMVYGYAAASTIGHELTHGFDDEGRQFDEKGNLHNWWLPQDGEKFTKKVEGIQTQFSNYVVLDSMHVNGKATSGENIADLGGIVIALDAFKKTEQYKKGEKINGFTPTQRYFLGYALGWLGHERNERLAQQILTDVHAPAFLRVNGPFSNVPDFYDAFNIKQGQKMWRADSVRVKIW